MTYSTLQQKWLKHHYTRWQREYGWSAGEFAKRVKQPPAALAEVLGIPVEEFGPFPEAATPLPVEPMVLPDPASAIVTVEGVEIMPRASPPVTAAPKPPYRPRAFVMLTPGHHVIDGVDVDVQPPADSPNATLVAHEVAPHVLHVVDGRNAVVQMTSMFEL